MKCFRPLTAAVLLAAFSVNSVSAQPKLIALTNADVIRLVAIHIPDQTVIAVIKEAKVTTFDVSASAISELTVLGVPATVIAAMRLPSVPMARSTPAPTLRPIPVTAMPAATTLGRYKFAKLYAAGKPVDVAARYARGAPASSLPPPDWFSMSNWSWNGTEADQFQQLLFALDVEISSAKDLVTTDAEIALLGRYMLDAMQFRYAVLVYLTPGWRKSWWICCGVDPMEEALTALSNANQIYLEK